MAATTTATSSATPLNGAPKPLSKQPETVSWMSLPNKKQLFILALCRLSEPLSNTCLLPYIYYLMKSIVSPSSDPLTEEAASKISTMSGFLVAAFPLAQFATSMLWGRLSDARGRKFIILFGLLVSMISNLAFGFSKSFGALLFWRILAGLANGNVGVMRTMTAEIVKERKYQTRAFLLLPLVFNSGMVAGLALGGCLADPVTNLPWLFGPEGLFNITGDPKGVAWTLLYPYALPAMLNAGLLFLALSLAVFGLRETLPGKEDTPDIGLAIGRSIYHSFQRVILRRDQASAGYTALQLDDLDSQPLGTILEQKPLPPLPVQPPQSLPPLKSIFTKDVLTTMVSFGLLPLHNSAYMHILPVYLSTPRSPTSNHTPRSPLAFTGGLGLPSPTIGIQLAALGILGILLQLFIYPRLQRRIGTLNILRLACVLFPLAYFSTPFLSLLPASGGGRWAVIGSVIWTQVMARTLAIPSTVILLTEAAPEKRVLGSVHGAGNMLSSLARAVGPAVGGWVFAVGVREGMIGLGWWCYLVVVAIGAACWSWVMRGKRVEGE
ncbi:MFS general substrate transporter [Aulographum hederae CBS 113979]|uniref:MFS general substrate transporter n=1 Tax=Aulographum hederae CBS 113979 TaxID=1176131 RepID=A0A6G1GKT8_9PEZI|nr:MFS general substrate transporter [Aulographum hederae CBS 113979]